MFPIPELPEMVRSLPVCAPPNKHLDLAIASLPFPVRKEDRELLAAGRRQIVPVSLFFDEKTHSGPCLNLSGSFVF